MASSPFPTTTGPQKSPSQPSPQSVTTTNGGSLPSATTITAPPDMSIRGASKIHPSPISTILSKNWSSEHVAQLTAVGRLGTTPSKPAEDKTEPVETTPNPAEVLKTGFPVSRPEDAPTRADKPTFTQPPTRPTIITQPAELAAKDESRLAGLGGLPSIATAASAMQIDGDASSANTNPGAANTNNGGVSATSVGTSPVTPDTAKYLADAMQAHMFHTPLSAHPMSADITTPTTPGFPLSATTPTTPYTPSQLQTPTGSGRSKHVCTHCSQTFTRHHNLKSHLLTHSHEKPFPCKNCNARFRRLHDLKRHSKLHTGERPHMCDKCGRKFARGDALARHARGEGGCAGRRTSMGGLIDGDTMMNDGTDADDDIERMLDESGDTHMGDGNDTTSPNNGAVDSASGGVTPDAVVSPPTASITSGGARRPASLPSIKTNVADNTHHNQNHLHPHQSQAHQLHQLQPYGTYPPMTPLRSAAGPSPGSLFPPTPTHQGKGGTPISATSSPSILRRATSPMTGVQATPILSSGGMTESPRPISPAQQQQDGANRAKSPLNHFHASGKQHQQYAPPMTPQSAQPRDGQMNAPFGPMSGATPSQGRQQAPSSNPQSQSQPSQQQTQQNKTQQPPSHSSQVPAAFPQQQPSKGTEQQPTSNPVGNPNMFENERGVWDYIKELERRVVELEERQRSQAELIAQMQQFQQRSLAQAAVAAGGNGGGVSGNNIQGTGNGGS